MFGLHLPANILVLYFNMGYFFSALLKEAGFFCWFYSEQSFLLGFPKEIWQKD